MKSKRIIMLFISVLTLMSCEKIKDALKVEDVEFATPIKDVKVPFVGIKNLGLPPIPITLNVDIDEYIKEETKGAAGIDNVKSAKVVAFKARKTGSEPEADLKVFKDAEIWLKSPNFEEKKVAWVKNNTNSEEITFEVDSDVELIDYLKAPEGEKKLILKNIKVGESGLTKFVLELTPTWKASVGL